MRPVEGARRFQGMVEVGVSNRSYKVQRFDPIQSLFARSILNGYLDEAVSLVLARVAMSENLCIDHFDTLKRVLQIALSVYPLMPAEGSLLRELDPIRLRLLRQDDGDNHRNSHSLGPGL